MISEIGEYRGTWVFSNVSKFDFFDSLNRGLISRQCNLDREVRWSRSSSVDRLNAKREISRLSKIRRSIVFGFRDNGFLGEGLVVPFGQRNYFLDSEGDSFFVNVFF